MPKLTDSIPQHQHKPVHMRDDWLDTLMDRVLARDMLVQVNAEYFLHPRTARMAFENLRRGKIQLIGSDCHNLTTRAPNLGAAWQAAGAFRMRGEFDALVRNTARLLGQKGSAL